MDAAFRDYVKTSQLWNHAGALIAAAIDAHLKDVDINRSPEVKKLLEGALRLLDHDHAVEEQHHIAEKFAQSIATGALVA